MRAPRQRSRCKGHATRKDWSTAARCGNVALGTLHSPDRAAVLRLEMAARQSIAAMNLRSLRRTVASRRRKTGPDIAGKDIAAAAAGPAGLRRCASRTSIAPHNAGDAGRIVAVTLIDLHLEYRLAWRASIQITGRLSCLSLGPQPCGPSALSQGRSVPLRCLRSHERLGRCWRAGRCWSRSSVISRTRSAGSSKTSILDRPCRVQCLCRAGRGTDRGSSPS